MQRSEFHNPKPRRPGLTPFKNAGWVWGCLTTLNLPWRPACGLELQSAGAPCVGMDLPEEKRGPQRFVRGAKDI